MTSKPRARPTHDAFLVNEESNSSIWTKVGAAWRHEDGKGVNIALTPGLAVSGMLVLREVDPQSETRTK